jgi:predicted ATPase
LGATLKSTAMEISFLYIEKYGKVTNMGLNFNSKFRYSYNASNQEMTIEKNRDFSNRFYENLNAEIVGISAIIGANGVGKTTILNFIKNNLTDGVGGVHAPCLVCVYDKDENKHIIYRHGINEPRCKHDNLNIEISELKSEHHHVNFRNDYYSIPAFDKLTFINYSGFLDLTQNEGEFGSSFNITTSYLAYNSTKKHTLEDWRFNLNEIEVFRIHEVEKQLRFYFNHKELLPFSAPEYIQVKINYFKSNQLHKNLTDKKLSYQNEIIQLSNQTIDENTQRVIENLSVYIQNIDDFNEKVKLLYSKLHEVHYNSIKNEIYNQLLISLLYSHISTIQFLVYITKILTETINSVEEEKINGAANILNKLFEIYGFTEIPENEQAKLIDYTNILSSIEEILSCCELNGEFESDHIILNPENEKKLEKFFLFQSNNSFANFVDFFWPLSSGQQAIFSMYSRFYDVVHRTIQFDNIIIKENILIVLDEAEIALHPEWQRSFLADFVNIVSKIFQGKKIQIILTTHSPFLISDLVNSQINFIEYDEANKKSKVVENPMMNKKSTFGANISTLLNDAFFMNDGFIGGIALVQMDKFIDFILNKEITILKKDYDYIDWFINQIGEPLIKNKIIQLLENRLSIDLLNTQERLDEIEKRLNNRDN